MICCCNECMKKRSSSSSSSSTSSSSSSSRVWPLALVTLLLCSQIGPAVGFFDLYINSAEVRKLMGVPGEIYYVRNGFINEYAIKFVVPVSAQVDKLHFTWENRAGRPLPYTISLDVSNPSVMESSLNITSVGDIPMGGLQTWALLLTCGAYDAEIDITIHLNVSLPWRNSTSLELKRKKVCLKEESNYTERNSPYEEVLVAAPGSTGSQVFYAAVGCACAFIAAIFVLVIAYYVRDQKARRHREPLQESRNLGSACSVERSTGLGPSQTFLSAEITPPASAASVSTYRKLDDRSNRELYERIQEISVQRSRVRLLSSELEGTFGRIYRGTYHEESLPVGQEVLIKTAADHASQAQMSLLLCEGLALSKLSHPGLLSVIGVSAEDNKAPLLLYPYTGYKNMKKFLMRCKVSGTESPARALTTQELVEMALQTAKAIQYLHRKRLIHRDIAARNCVVDDELRVQVTDNALSRDLFPQDYYCLGDNENRPIKWLAMESLLNKTFSPASDVWAFGVFLWELTTLAQQPYAEVDPFEMATYLGNGYRLTQPVNCPDELFAVMAYCWAMSPDERPTFSQLIVCLQEFNAQLTKYV